MTVSPICIIKAQLFKPSLVTDILVGQGGKGPRTGEEKQLDLFWVSSFCNNVAIWHQMLDANNEVDFAPIRARYWDVQRFPKTE